MDKKLFQLEKAVWTENDFPEMGWMDVQIWSAFAEDLMAEYLLDIDYIFKSQDPGPGETYYKFWVSPCTMVFENVDGVSVQMNSKEGAMEVVALHMEPSKISPDIRQFRFECGQGELIIQATGFKMFVRRTPTLIEAQYFSYTERGGIGFERAIESP